MSFLTERIIAHRGLFNNVDIPENSLVACQKAIDNNYAIEFDVQATKDDVLVVFHDDSLMRMTGKSGLVCDYTWEELKDLKLLDTQHTIPTLKQWLDTVDGQTPLVVEIKNHPNIGKMEQAVLDMLNQYKGDFCVESFNPFIVRWFAVHAPHIIRGQLAESFESTNFSPFRKWLLSNLKLLKYSRAQFIAYNVEHIDKLKKLQHYRKKIPIIVWTVKNQQQYEATKHLYDNIIFDSFIPQL